MDWTFFKKSLNKMSWVYYIPLFILAFFFFLIMIFKVTTFIDEVRSLGFSYKVKRQGPVKARGIYISSWSASEPKKIKKLVDFVLNTNLNAVVIDIKDVTGKVSYKTDVDLARKNHLYELRIKDIKKTINHLKDKGIYVIGRISVFKDDALARRKNNLALQKQGNIWEDMSNLAWVDPASKIVWDYNIALAKEGLSLGFEEINFDYIRFPSDGDIANIDYPVWKRKKQKQEIIKSFFKYQHSKLKDHRVSADLFGMTMSHVRDGFDMNIGQRLEDAYGYFGYICPMLYPSYFRNAFSEIKKPFEKPYEVIDKSFKNAQDSLNKLNKDEKPFIRPWIQAFSTNQEKIKPDFIKLQKQAVEDNDSYGFLLWSSKNDYFDFQEVFKN